MISFKFKNLCWFFLIVCEHKHICPHCWVWYLLPSLGSLLRPNSRIKFSKLEFAKRNLHSQFLLHPLQNQTPGNPGTCNTCSRGSVSRGIPLSGNSWRPCISERAAGVQIVILGQLGDGQVSCAKMVFALGLALVCEGLVLPLLLACR